MRLTAMVAMGSAMKVDGQRDGHGEVSVATSSLRRSSAETHPAIIVLNELCNCSD